MIRRSVLILNLIIGLFSYCHGNSLSYSITEIKNRFHLTIIYDSIVPDTWSAVTYDMIRDSAKVENYLELLEKEYAKYPADYFDVIGVRTIVLGNNLKYSQQNRAAVPDPYRHSLFFSVDGAYGNSTEVYLVHVLHHELNHCAEYAKWENMNYKWDKWKKINPLFFRYIGSGADAYNNLNIDWYIMDHPRKAFINLYSTTAQEEDRSEIVALIMSDQERKYLNEYCKIDKKLKKKVVLTLDYLNDVSHTNTNYWTKVTDQINKN